MSSAVNKSIVIKQIVRLKNVVKRWKAKSLMRRTEPLGRTPSGCVAVYVGPDRRRFVVPTRFLNLPVFAALLGQAEEEFGFPADGAVALPCDAGFFQQVLWFLEEDEAKFAGFGLDPFVQMISRMVLEPYDLRSCIESFPSSPVKSCRAFAPLLEKNKALKV